ncbi:LysR family transcriptional regulator [Maritimibacter dapengensis]|uniref:LysR family transcriptional regulator n=1 Tax=Maritimibacter dapengensis TaxID=2836868 RepID=A0ABS6T0C1_9RHOB|nr:LysR family transcriptional regulator [Maritimibacter dapengensis]MBV7378683.1 LysR family transcriptional regulator [Maritimibacter dapengensis]
MLNKLEMFIALANERHFGRAAEAMGVTQPTLSAGIKQLEAELGVKLVQRGSRFGGLTPEGARTLDWARQIVGDAKRLREEMRFSREGLSGHLRLAVIPTALTWASRLAARFSAAHPRVRFTILSRTSAEILEMLENFETDVGLSYLDNEPLGRVTTRQLYRETYTLVTAPDDPLAGRSAVDWADLVDHRLCLLTPDMQNRRIINRAFMEAGLSPEAGMESNSTVVLVHHVEQGGWSTVLPVDMAQSLATGRNVALVAIAPGTPGPAVGLVAPYQEPQTPVLQTLIDMATEVAQQN